MVHTYRTPNRCVPSLPRRPGIDSPRPGLVDRERRTLASRLSGFCLVGAVALAALGCGEAGSETSAVEEANRICAERAARSAPAHLATADADVAAALQGLRERTVDDLAAIEPPAEEADRELFERFIAAERERVDLNAKVLRLTGGSISVEDLDRRERVVFRELTPRVEAAEKELAETGSSLGIDLCVPEVEGG